MLSAICFDLFVEAADAGRRIAGFRYRGRSARHEGRRNRIGSDFLIRRRIGTDSGGRHGGEEIGEIVFHEQRSGIKVCRSSFSGFPELLFLSRKS